MGFLFSTGDHQVVLVQRWDEIYNDYNPKEREPDN